ncbi:MAG: dethiobiotin synthase [Proteobacteria bacterium]|nr:dethiobiotin synthase [Pseudomonadota bacterium]
MTRNPRHSGVFIAGTDTGIGKTIVSCALLRALCAAGLRATGMKPVASGCAMTPDGLRNDDALALIAASDSKPEYADCNPFAFAEPVSPHIAAAATPVTMAPIAAAFSRLAARADFVVVEGVGGWLAPLSDRLLANAIPHSLRLPAILVVGLKLGCLNHAQLTARAIRDDGCKLIGWIGNHIDPDMARPEENVATLRRLLPVPCLGILPFAATSDPHAQASRMSAAIEAIVSA